ncbi:homeobox protein SIX2 [Paragonimus westermani]|uniref:Homeobox protein SIX2 n=1 Tax=Paragonimus westermani TaxID=34504 RepID=A0A5J4NZQ0_9TREM|nr:homeobox protein SIX2 [Paragonimus westermani]
MDNFCSDRTALFRLTHGSDMVFWAGVMNTQVDCICEALYHRRDTFRLRTFLGTMPQGCPLYWDKEGVQKAKALLCFLDGCWDELYHVLENFSFSPHCHTELQQLWFQGHYMEVEQSRGHSLGADR